MSSHKKRRELNRATAEHTNARIRAELAQGIVNFENLMEHAMGVRIKELERERDTAWAQAHRLALELECLIMDTKDNAVVSKWWDSAFEAIEEYQAMKPGSDEALHCLRKVLAIGVACGEQHGMPCRPDTAPTPHANPFSDDEYD